ncbi:unnamed protein product [Phaedon cochleariae]|uniref:Uncharacterized protein n=1 Tax=Phaedon cochleariae TaxID=80249 RepID=A0A9P0GNE0_PHACE|nr:unnamed protein product [Phaedon cochleariae]
MSLTFRRVTKISKRSRKSQSKSRKSGKPPTSPSINDTPYLENFPSLNTVYKSDIFGTPIKYHFSCGSDQIWNMKYRVKCHVLVFMEEYRDKSVEELRWEDYQCNRRGRQLFEDKKYLKCLCFKEKDRDEFIASKSLDNSSSCLVDIDTAPTSITSFESYFNTEIINNQECKSDNPTIEITEAAVKSSVQAEEEDTSHPPVNVTIDLMKHSDSTTREEEIQIVKHNLLRFFENAEPDAKMPYDFLPQNPKFYLPCADVKFVYQNARPSISSLKANDSIQGFNSIVESPKPNLKPSSDSQTSLDMYEGLLEKKYSLDNKFCKDYFWNKINPYPGTAVTLGICRGKYALSGRCIVD